MANNDWTGKYRSVKFGSDEFRVTELKVKEVVFNNAGRNGISIPMKSSSANVVGTDLVEVSGDGTIAEIGSTTATAKFAGVAVGSSISGKTGEVLVFGIAVLQNKASGSSITGGERVVTSGEDDIIDYASGDHANTQTAGTAIEAIAQSTTGQVFIGVDFQGGE